MPTTIKTSDLTLSEPIGSFSSLMISYTPEYF